MNHQEKHMKYIVMLGDGMADRPVPGGEEKEEGRGGMWGDLRGEKREPPEKPAERRKNIFSYAAAAGHSLKGEVGP